MIKKSYFSILILMTFSTHTLSQKQSITAGILSTATAAGALYAGYAKLPQGARHRILAHIPSLYLVSAASIIALACGVTSYTIAKKWQPLSPQPTRSTNPEGTGKPIEYRRIPLYMDNTTAADGKFICVQCSAATWLISSCSGCWRDYCEDCTKGFKYVCPTCKCFTH